MTTSRSFAAILFLASVALAASSAPSRALAPPSTQVTRADITAACTRLDRMLRAHPPAAGRIADLNRACDRATLAFFGGNFPQSVRMFHQAADGLPRPGGVSAEQALIASLKVRIDPAVYIQARGGPAVARVMSLYGAPIKSPQVVPLRLRVRDSTGKVVLERPFQVDAVPDGLIDVTVPLSVNASHEASASAPATRPDEDITLPVGTYNVELAGGGEDTECVLHWSVTPTSHDELRIANDQRLAELPTATGALRQAAAACRARNRLLGDDPSEIKSAQFLCNQGRLAREVADEIEALSQGRDPYHRRVGDYWRVAAAAATEIPVRVYAPAAVNEGRPLPLVIALHGTGGDENTFMESYGAGRIKELADQHGFVVASPQTFLISMAPANLDAIIDAMAHDYPIDRRRIYVLGHSMGAMVSSTLATTRAEVIAAASCISGGRTFVPKAPAKAAPILVISAALDPLSPPEKVQAATQAAAGTDLTFWSIRDFGHTLVVGHVLGDAIAWLLEHQLGGPAATRASPPIR